MRWNLFKLRLFQETTIGHDVSMTGLQNATKHGHGAYMTGLQDNRRGYKCGVSMTGYNYNAEKMTL